MAEISYPLTDDVRIDMESIHAFGALVRQRAPFEIADPSKGHHADAEAAQKAGLRGPVAYSLHYAGVVERLLDRALGSRWSAGGRLSMAFLRPVYAGDVLAVRIGDRPLDRAPPCEDERLEWLQVDVYNQIGELAAAGAAGIPADIEGE